MSLTPAAQYSISVHVKIGADEATLEQLQSVISGTGAKIVSLQEVSAEKPNEKRISVYCFNEHHQEEVVAAVASVGGVELLDSWDRTFKLHEGGKIRTKLPVEVKDNNDLAMVYTPGVARVCTAIQKDESLADSHTIRKNTVAIVSDGTAVLGLGDIGPKAAMPVMEGKAYLFKEFADVDAFPLCLDVDTPAELIETVERLAPSFGGINLEDIAAPGAFEIEKVLKERLDIPVFHDDQHGTAIVALAALENALKVVDKKLEEITVVITGLGAAGIAVAKIILQAGVGNLIGTDRKGVVYDGREGLNSEKQWLAENSNQLLKKGKLSDAIAGADVFIGLSGPGVVSVEDIESMAKDPIVFAMANPTPEVLPEEVGHLVAVMATGRSDYPNQINNVLAFPGIFRGALDAHASDITENMKLAAATAIANSVSESELAADRIMPSVFDRTVPENVAKAVKEAAIADDVSRS